MSKKNLARTVIEGGRSHFNTFDRRCSHGEERARSRDVARALLCGGDPEDAIFEPRRSVDPWFYDKLGPAMRWLRSQVGRPWNKVRSELFARFDTRTTAGRHILFDHVLREVEDARPLRPRRHGLWVSEQGVLRHAVFRRKAKK
jgi:hypothetical protein